MPTLSTDPPVMLPVLSRGKHRKPDKGACFMEFASYLAGERWSDHPSCTHSLLASLARQVNDVISNERRPYLAELIPSVIGINDDDLHLDALIARRAAAYALPVSAAWRQRVLAVAVLSSERILAELDGNDPNVLSEQSEQALAHAPDAANWAHAFAANSPTTTRGFRRHAGPTAVRCAVEGIAQACVPDPDGQLHQLLARVIDDCLAWTDTSKATQADTARWADACQLTGTRSA